MVRLIVRLGPTEDYLLKRYDGFEGEVAISDVNDTDDLNGVGTRAGCDRRDGFLAIPIDIHGKNEAVPIALAGVHMVSLLSRTYVRHSNYEILRSASKKADDVETSRSGYLMSPAQD